MHVVKIIAAFGVLLSAGCSSFHYDPDRPLARHYSSYNVTPPASPAQFATCNHYGCDGQAQVGLTTDQWRQVAELFNPAALDPATEREKISAAIGLLEQLVGPLSNTFADQACNNFKPPLESFQLDCVAEATNSTVYLQLLQQAQLLRWHRVSYPAQREVLLIFAPHVSAVIRQLDSGELFAVDSWFHANGENAVVVPLAIWQENFSPGPCR